MGIDSWYGKSTSILWPTFTAELSTKPTPKTEPVPYTHSMSTPYKVKSPNKQGWRGRTPLPPEPIHIFSNKKGKHNFGGNADYEIAQSITVGNLPMSEDILES